MNYSFGNTTFSLFNLFSSLFMILLRKIIFCKRTKNYLAMEGLENCWVNYPHLFWALFLKCVKSSHLLTEGSWDLGHVPTKSSMYLPQRWSQNHFHNRSINYRLFMHDIQGRCDYGIWSKNKKTCTIWFGFNCKNSLQHLIWYLLQKLLHLLFFIHYVQAMHVEPLCLLFLFFLFNVSLLFSVPFFHSVSFHQHQPRLAFFNLK